VSRPRDIILWGGVPFFGPKGSIHRSMAVALSDAGCRVLYVEVSLSPPGVPSGDPRWARYDPGNPECPPGSIRVVTLRRTPGLPVTFPPVNLDWNISRNRGLLREAVQRLGWRDPAMLHYGWYSAGLAGRVGQTLDVADCDDEHEEAPVQRRSYPGVRAYVRARERRLLSRLDGLVVTSAVLLETRSRECPRHRVLWNAIDPRLFSEPSPEPAALAGIPRPRLVLSGNLTHKYDFRPIERILESHPKLHVVLAGWVEDPRRVPRSPRIHPLGTLAQRDLAACLSHCDVGLIPLPPTRSSHASCPLKAFEYPAAGLAVVSSPNPVVEELAASHPTLYSVAPTVDAWASAVGRAVEASAGPGFPEEARSTVRGRTWAARAEALLAFFDELESSPRAPRGREK